MKKYQPVAGSLFISHLLGKDMTAHYLEFCFRQTTMTSNYQQQVKPSRTGQSSGNDGDGEALVSNERLSCDSPVMWPDQNFCESVFAKHVS